MILLDLIHHPAGWHKNASGQYFDGDSFNEIDVLAVEDGMAGDIAATVLFAGTPVLCVRAGEFGYQYSLPVHLENGDQQNVAAFLTEIGECDEEAVAFVAERGLDALWEEGEHCGEGYKMVEFVGLISESLHAAFLDRTPAPTGF